MCRTVIVRGEDRIRRDALDHIEVYQRISLDVIYFKAHIISKKSYFLRLQILHDIWGLSRRRLGLGRFLRGLDSVMVRYFLHHEYCIVLNEQ